MPRSLRLPSGPQRLALAQGHESALIAPLVFGGERSVRNRLGLAEHLGEALRLPAAFFGAGDAAAEEAAARQDWAPRVPDWANGEGERTSHGYTIVENVALLEVSGPLFARGFYSEWSGRYYPGYRDYVAALRASILADDRVDAVFPLYDTPGGYVAGNLEAANAFRALRQAAGGAKPVVAHTSELCCSAGQWLFAQADACFASEAAMVGSVGVRIMFFDVSGWLAKVGDTAHVWTSGDLKDMGSPFRAPTDEESALFQTEVDHLADRFYEGVALGRGLDVQAIRDSKGWRARTFTAGDPPPPADLDPMADGVDLIDGVMTEEEAFAIAQAMAGTPAPVNPPNPNTVSAAASRAATGEKAASGRDVSSAEETETPMSLTAKAAALRARAKKGDKAAQAELNKVLTALGAKAEYEEPESEDDDAGAEGDDDADAMDDEDADASAEGDGDDDANAEGDDDDDASAEDGEDDAEAVLSHPEAKGREALAARLSLRVAKGKITKAEAIADLKAAPKGSGIRSAAGFTPPGAKSGAPGSKGKGDDAQAALGAAMKRTARA